MAWFPCCCAPPPAADCQPCSGTYFLQDGIHGPLTFGRAIVRFPPGEWTPPAGPPFAPCEFFCDSLNEVDILLRAHTVALGVNSCVTSTAPTCPVDPTEDPLPPIVNCRLWCSGNLCVFAGATAFFLWMQHRTDTDQCRWALSCGQIAQSTIFPRPISGSRCDLYASAWANGPLDLMQEQLLAWRYSSTQGLGWCVSYQSFAFVRFEGP